MSGEMAAREYEMKSTSAPRSGAIQELDSELDRLEKTLERLSSVVAPVTNRFPGGELLSADRQEPTSELHMRAERLRDQCDRFNSILDRVAL